MATCKKYNRHPALSAMLGKRPSLLMALEPRILFDGAGADVIADVSADAFLPQDSGPAPDAPDTADAPVADAVPANTTTAPADTGAVADPASDPAPLTTPELSGQEQGGSSSPDTAQPDTTSSTAESTGAIASTVSDSAATSADTVINPADSTSPVSNTETTASTSPDATTPASTTLGTDSLADDILLATDPLAFDPVDPLTSTPISQVVFVDTAVKDYQLLVDGIINITDNDFTDTNPTGNVGSSTYTVSGSALVVTLGENPLDDISAVLANYQDLNAIHIVSHGSEGELILGNTSINDANIDQYNTFLSNLGDSLNETGDLLLYGCKVAADGRGQIFIDHVAAITRADVNASTNTTGSQDQGGDWILEAATGLVEASPLLNEQITGNWQGTLALYDNTGWIPLITPTTSQEVNYDTQASAADIVSTQYQAPLYMNYNAANDTIAFRFRLGGDNKTYFSAIAAVGIDANNDGIIDVLVGVDNQGNSNLLRIWDPGLGTNPKETTLTPTNYFYPEIHSTATTTGNYSYVTVSSSTDPDYSTINPWTNNIDSNINGNINDYFLSFQVPFKDILAYLNNKGISITSSTSVRFMFGTSTQANSINSDIGFVSGQIGSTSPWNTIGALTELVAPNPVTVMDVTPNSGSEGTVAANNIEHTVRLSGTDKYKDTTVNLTLNGYSGDGTVFYNEAITSIGDRYSDISKVQYSFNGTDFIDATVTNGAFYVVVPKGEIQAFTVRIVTKPDNYYENNEWYELSAKTSANTNPVTATGTINNDDSSPVLSVVSPDAIAVEGTADNNTVTYTVEWTNPSALPTDIWIHPDITNSAVDPSDIASIAFTIYDADGNVNETHLLDTQLDIHNFFSNEVKITIPAYTTKYPVCTVTFADDNIYEKSEQLVFSLVRATNATIDSARSSASATIYDEDGFDVNDHLGDMPTLSIKTVSEAATEGSPTANTLVYEVSQNNLSNFDSTVLVKLGATSSASALDIDTISYTDLNGDIVPLSSPAAIASALENGIAVKIEKGRLTAPTITITVKDDTIYEGSETLTLTLDQSVNATTSAATNTASGAINDNDSAPIVTAVHGSASYEGTATDPDNPGYINHLAYKVDLSNASISVTSVHIALVQAQSTADFTTDLNTVSRQLHISFDNENWVDFPFTDLTAEVKVPDGATSFWVHVVPVADSIYEHNETVALSAWVGDQEAIIGTGTIINDDLAPTFTVSSVMVTDGAPSYANFTIKLLNPSHDPITLDLATGIDGDSATKDEDYFSAIEVLGDDNIWRSASTVTFAPGSVERYARVQIIKDSFDEGNEIFTLTATNYSTGETGNTTASGEAMIYDGEAPPSISIDDVRVTEGENPAAVFTVTLDKAPAETLRFGYYTVGLTAKDGTDYTSVNVLPNDTDAIVFTTNGPLTQTISIDITDDIIFEGEEEFLVYLTGIDGNSKIFGKKTIGAGTIVSDDPIPTITVWNADSVAEPEYDPVTGEGTTAVYSTFTIELKSPSEVTTYVGLYMSTPDDTASLGEDYTAALEYSVNGSPWVAVPDAPSGGKWVTLDPGVQTFLVRVPVLADSVYEPTEEFTLHAFNTSAIEAQGSENIGTGVITNTHSGLTVSIADAVAVDEGRSLQYTVTLDGGTSYEDITIPLSYSGTANAADLNPDQIRPEAVTIKAGETSATVVVATLTDNILEGSESVILTLGTPTTASMPEAATYVSLNPDSSRARGTINDNSPALTVYISDAGAVDEGQALRYRISLTGGVSAQDITVPITFSSDVDGVAAIEGTDFTAIATATIKAGETEAILEIPTLYDSLIDPEKIVKVVLGTPTTIIADGTPEGKAVELAIGQDAGSAQGLIHDMSPQVRIIDFNGDSAGTSTFAENEPRDGHAFSISAPLGVQTLTIAGKEIDLTLRSTDPDNPSTDLVTPVPICSNKGTLTVIGYNSSTGEILCLYEPKVLDHSDTSDFFVIKEGNDRIITDDYLVELTDTEGHTATGTFILAITDTVPVAYDYTSTTFQGEPVVINVAENDSISADDTNPATEEVENTWEITEEPRYGALSPNDDGTYTYTPGANFNGTDSFTYTITDGDGSVDTATVYITVNPIISTISDAYAAEGDNLVHTVTLSGTTTSPATYKFSLANGSAVAGSDYTATPVFSDGVIYDDVTQLIRVPENVSRFTVTYPTLTDTEVENDETTQLTIGGKKSTGTILGDNTSISAFSISNSSVTEGGLMTFTVTRSGNNDVAQSVTVSTSHGTAGADDYTDRSETLFFAVGETSKTFTVQTTQDNLYEPDETFTVSLSDPTGGAVIGTASAVGTIFNDDVPPTPVATDDVGAVIGPIAEGSATDDNQPTFSGIGTTGNIIDIYDNGQIIGTTTVEANGQWSFASPILADGSHSITITETNAQGVSPQSEALSFIVDTSKPLKPGLAATDNVAADGVTVLDPPEALANNSFTNDPTPLFYGNVGASEAGGTIKLYDGLNPDPLVTAVVDANGNWSVTSTALAEGSHTITATLTDKAGQTSESSDPFVITVDTGIPAKPAFTATDNVAADGITVLDPPETIANNSTTNDATPTFSGKASEAEAGNTINVYDGAALIGTTTVASDGTWAYTPTTKLSEGPHSITVTLTDQAGQVSPVSDALNFTVDAVAPTNGWVISANTASVIEGGSINVSIAYDGPVVPGQSVSVKLTNDNVNTGDYNWNDFLNAVKQAADLRPDLSFDRDNATLKYTAPNYSISTSSTAPPSTSGFGTTAYSWETLTNYTSIRPPTHGGHTKTVNLGFDFTFFGETYKYISFNEDGYAQLFKGDTVIAGPRNAVTGGDVIPGDMNMPGPAIAYYFTDMYLSDFTNLGYIHYTTVGDKFIVEFQSFNAATSTNPGLMQMVLDKSNGSIRFNYSDTDFALGRIDNGSDTSIGIKHAGTDPPIVRYSNNNQWVNTGVSVVFQGGPQPTMPALTVALKTIDDTVVEGAEQFKVSLTTPGGYPEGPGADKPTAIVAPGRGSITTTIFDNEPPRLTAKDNVAGDGAPLASASETTINNHDYTNDNTPTFSGVGASGDRITIKDGSTVLGTTIVGADGTWTYPPTSALADGVHTITATRANLVPGTGLNDVPAKYGPESLASSIIFTVDTSASIDIQTITNESQVPLTTDSDNYAIINISDASGDITVKGTTTGVDAGQTVTVQALDNTGTKILAQDTTTVLTDGTWTLSISAGAAWITDGNYKFKAIVDDKAGNTATDTDAFSVDLTATVDIRTIAGEAQNPDTTGNSSYATINISDKASGFAVSGVTTGVEDEQIVTVKIYDGALLVATLNGAPVTSGAWSTSVPANATWIQDGKTYSFTATVSDKAGNTASDTDLTAATDLVAPAAPVFTATDNVDGFGQAITDPDLFEAITDGSVTNDATPTFSGTGIAGDTITVTLSHVDAEGNAVVDEDGNPVTVIAATTVDTGGNWSVDTGILPDGVYTSSVTATDGAGNVSAAATGPGFTVDKVVPSLDAQTILYKENQTKTSDVLGTVIAYDADGSGIASYQFSGGSDTNADGIKETSADGFYRIDSNGNITLTASGLTSEANDYETGNVSDEYAIIVTDKAGNSSSATITLTELNVNDAGSVVLGGTPTQGQTLTATISDPDGVPASVTYVWKADGAVIDGATQSTYTLTQAEVGKTITVEASYTDNGGTAEAVSASTTSAVANAGTPVTPTVAPVVTDNVANDGSWAVLDPAEVIADDGTTNDNTPGITVPATSVGTGETPQLVVDGVVVASTSVNNADGSVTLTPVTALPDGSHQLSYNLKDDGPGNVSGNAPAMTLTVDTTAPEAPTINPIGTTGDSTPTITGTGEPGATVVVKDEDGNVIGTATVNPDGTWSVTPTNPLPDGTQDLSATQTDPAGNESGPGSATATIDTTAPDAPIIDPIGTTGDNTPTITGTGEPGATVVVKDEDGNVIGTTTVNPDGTWSIIPSTPLSDGSHNLTAVQTDAAGNTSDPASVVVRIDTTSPSQPKPMHPAGQHGMPQASAPAAPEAAPQPRAPFGSTGLHALTSSTTAAGAQGAGMSDRAGQGWRNGLLAPELDELSIPRALSPVNTLNLDEGLDQLIGTDTRQYIRDTVNHTWERVERWYGTGTPGTEQLRYDALGGAQDPFNGFTSPMESRMLEDLSRLINTILDGQTLTGGGESGLSPIVAESRTLQNQLDRADIMGREMERLSRIFAEEKE